VNSQDSLWQVKGGSAAGGSDTRPVVEHANYDPSQHAGYDPSQHAGYAADAGGYGDYGYYPPAQEAYPAYRPQDDYGRAPYDAGEGYGAAPTARARPHLADTSYRGVSGQPDPYAQREQPDLKPPVQPSFDESLESGYSTPNAPSRRVIREIIV